MTRRTDAIAARLLDTADAPACGWRQRARCRDCDPELFFPHPSDFAQAEAAKAVCALCPVKAECLASALEAREEFGVFGGLDERERRKLSKARDQMCRIPRTPYHAPISAAKVAKANRRGRPR